MGIKGKILSHFITIRDYAKKLYNKKKIKITYLAGNKLVL